MTERISIESSPDGSSMVIRIRVSAVRRVVDALKGTVSSAGIFLLASLIRPDRWAEPGEFLAIIAGVSIALGFFMLLRAGEIVHVTAGEVRILKQLESYSVARADQAAPTYSALPSRWLFPQRQSGERGSGVLLFGGQRGVRFGVDLDAAEAHQVVGAFALPTTPRPSDVESSGIAGRVIRVLLWAVSVIAVAFVLSSDPGLSESAVVAIVGVAGFVLLLIDDAVDRRFPQRVKLG